MAWPSSAARSLRAFASLAGAERRVVLQSGALLPLVSSWLVGAGLAGAERRLARVVAALPRARAPLPPARIATLVGAAARRHPLSSTCLARSLTLRAVLSLHGHRGELRIGVRRGDADLDAHAWIELDGLVLNDDADVGARYAPFPRREGNGT